MINDKAEKENVGRSQILLRAQSVAQMNLINMTTISKEQKTLVPTYNNNSDYSLYSE